MHNNWECCLYISCCEWFVEHKQRSTWNTSTRWIEAQIMFFFYLHWICLLIWNLSAVVCRFNKLTVFSSKNIDFCWSSTIYLLSKIKCSQCGCLHSKKCIQRIQEVYAASSCPQLGDRSMKLEIKLASLSIRAASTIIFAKELFASLCTQKQKMPISMCLLSKRHEPS